MMIGDGAVDHIVDNIDHSIGMVILVMAPMSLLFIILIMMLVWTGLETTNINNIASNNSEVNSDVSVINDSKDNLDSTDMYQL